MKLHTAAALSGALLLAGCKDLAEVAGIASGAASGAATASPAIGIAVGIGVGTAGNFISNYYTRVRAGAEQDVIAETAGRLAVGGEAPWRIRHTIPIGNEHGRLRVIDEITTPIAVCREVAFSVADGGGPSPWYIVDVCRDPKGWKWATAEPAVERWRTIK